MGEPILKYMRSAETSDNPEKALTDMASECVKAVLRDIERIERYHARDRLPLTITAVPIAIDLEPHYLVLSGFAVARPFKVKNFLEAFQTALEQMLEEAEKEREHLVATTRLSLTSFLTSILGSPL